MTQTHSEAVAKGVSTTRAIRNFALVGAVGFAIEAALLTTLTQFAGWQPWHARVPSFLTAVLATWTLNRKHTFCGRGLQPRSLEAFLYAAIQTCGAIINLALFGMCLSYSRQLSSWPVIPLGIGAAAGFTFNFTASNVLLYAQCRAKSTE